MTAIILDTETTGFVDPEPIEVAAINLKNRFEFDGYFKPSKRISFGAMATHHIMDKDLVDCLPSSIFSLDWLGQSYEQFRDIEYMIGHGVEYDWSVIGKPNVKRICTLALARDLWGNETDSCSLGALFYMLLGEEARAYAQNAHNALADCKMTMILLSNIIATLGIDNQQDDQLWPGLYHLSETARIPAYIDFGKHKDMRYADVPNDYKQWYFRQKDQDPVIVEAMQRNRTVDILGRPIMPKV